MVEGGMAEFPIVGIGSSAGGLEALQTLFRALPADSGLAYVIAAHLDPTQKSHLTELLSRYTEMPVVQIEKSLEVKPDHVYVIAPDQELTIREGVIHTDKPTAPRGHRHPVDSFFRSLAEDQRERAIAIILSGTGTNGSQGVRFIKAEGGIALAQDPNTAAFPGMPRNAIATGLIDLVLPPDQMPDALVNLARQPYVREPPDRFIDGTPDDQLQTMLRLVRASTRRDFGGYRKRTLLRRIHRRMGLHRLDGMPAYIERLRDDPGEAKALAADLTINVTGFFRDPDAWQALVDRVIAPLVRDRPSDSTIRVWVPGCSTGEEAYSIAILLLEEAERARKTLDLKVFATDVAEEMLSSARAGVYPASIAPDVLPERLERWFKMQEDTYAIRKALRDTITFAPQNLLQDPPFARMDLISCRNLLIYLEPAFQKQVLALFHFALREGGHLLLGPAETIADHGGLFESVSRKWRIYRRLGPARRNLVNLPLIRVSERPAEAEAEPESGRAPSRSSTAGELMDRALLERYAPASALIDRQLRVHYLRGPTDDYLRPPSGEPSYNLIGMAREGLQTMLRNAVRKAIDEGQEVTVGGRVRRGGSWHPVQIVVAPLRSTGDADVRLLVSFSERAPATESDPRARLEEATPDGELQAELEAAREELRLTIVQMEAANEDLKASNEEIRSINEELQASNEELETSKEELQSLNEELNTVNAQLQAKVSELEARTDDLNNLLNSTDVATLFLDRSLRVRWFTPRMKSLLELLPTDLGRPVAHFAQRFTGGALLEEARSVLERLLPVDTEVEDDLGRWYIRHIVPYRTAHDRIDGVIVTFTDISERKRAEREVEAAKEFAETIVDTIREPLLVLKPDLQVLSANESFYRTFGVVRAETQDRPLYELGNRQWDIPQLRRLLEDVLPHNHQFNDFEVEHEFDGIGRRIMLLNARRLDSIQLILLAIEDVTERRQAEETKGLLARELSHRVKNTLAVVQSLALQTDGHRSIETYREAFLGRLQALARAQNLLHEAHWRGTDLRALVEQAVAAYRGDHPERVEVHGEPVAITARQGLGLSLILHELATNAAKYGALTRSEGRLHVSWQIEQHSVLRLRLRWQERHGPVVGPPREKGFGTRLIERACEYELGGKVELEYAPGGLSCELLFPVR
jgi:two-component system, chemotaxis family, CheB/CheR fusion protein